MFEQHLRLLKTLEPVILADHTFKPYMFNFGYRELKFRGDIVTIRGVRLSSNNLAAVELFAGSRNREGVLHFLHLCLHSVLFNKKITNFV